MIHRIDKYILKELLTHELVSFSELRPPGVESNALTYRLKRLLKERLVSKNSKGLYYLTSHGRIFTDHLNLNIFVAREFPRPLNLLVVRRPGNEWLLYKRYIHPLKDLIGLPGSNVELGETIAERAERRLHERRGLTTKFSYRGGGYMTFYKRGELEGYNQINILANLGTVTGNLKAESNSGLGLYFWQKNPDFSKPQYIPSLLDIERLLKSKKFPFFFELEYNIKN